MPANIEFIRTSYLYASDNNVYALSGYNRTLYRYEEGAAIPMKEIVELPEEVGQVPQKLIELNGGRIAVAMRSGKIFSVEKDGTQYTAMLDHPREAGSAPVDMLQSFDGWIYVSAEMGGAHDKGAIYKMLSDGSSYTPLRHFNGDDGDSPNNIIFKRAQQSITFDPLEERKTTDPSFTPNATSSSGARIVFTSSNPSVAIIEDGRIKPVGAGTTIITASMPANSNYYAATSIQRELIVSKAEQTITFPEPEVKILGAAPFELTASSSSGLPITFVPESSNVRVEGKQVTLLKAGSARIKATQAGDTYYYAAAPIVVEFCVNPARPSISATGELPNIVLRSSNATGNQWYKDNHIIDGSTSQTLSTQGEPGSYTVISTVDNCSSAASDAYNVVVTGIESNPEIRIDMFPNPVTDVMLVRVSGNKVSHTKVEMLDTFGRVINVLDMQNGEITVNTETYPTGIYMVRFNYGKHVVTRKFLKE
jgi:hypothetical protein